MSNYSPGVLEHARNTTNHLIPDLLAAPMRITAAEFGAKKATELMGGRTTPAIKFFRESSDTGDVEGSAACGDSEIHVRSNLSPEQCVEVAAHETAHAL
ncbi:MAG TPA: hypothetical protein VHE82_07395, partial [Gemmatimonadaceae bacterium]|nr:hypothetical protein [Gemmatimonadaceae bacterium]